MRTTQVSVTPDDDSLVRVTLPADWDDGAAQALLELSAESDRAGRGGVRMSIEAARWIDPLETHDLPVRSLSYLLLMRQGAPGRSVWNSQHERRPAFVLNLAAFVQAGVGFGTEEFVAAVRLACRALRVIARESDDLRNGELPLLDLPPRRTLAAPETSPVPQSPVADLLLTNLDACLALLGLDYDSEAGRDTACCLAALTTLVAHAGRGADDVPLPPQRSVVPGLAAVARAIWSEAAVLTDAPLSRIETGFSTPGPVDGLLGVETCGLAPAFSPLSADGHLALSTRARLAARGLTPEAALALSLAGEPVLPLPGPDAHLAMHRALAGFVDRLPARPEPLSLPMRARLSNERGAHRPLPARHGGFSQKASVGGHKLFLRTGEYEDGTLGEVSLTPARESPMVRGLMDCFSQSVSIGLQYGAPLDAYVDAFAYTRFGPGGTVEGDPVASYATSLLDYAFRALSDAYLGKRLPDAPHRDEAPEGVPMLPLELPEATPDHPPSGGRRARLRLVS
ncbi:vitamin B12-dependent ribonucleotide reductase [Ameyamaea chiangmaiensis NBRC 103196]|nr:vitamin B12-dependent ribonucleotide reductase [Ameyamaea chiangmaiensis NBRC 103196]